MTRNPDTLPPLRVLVLEDDLQALRQFAQYFRERGRDDYRVHVDEASTRTLAVRFLKTALADKNPYDAAILDYRVPEVEGAPPTKSLEVARFAIENPGSTRWVGQLTAYTEDPELVAFWAQQEFRGFTGQLLDKRDTRVLDKAATAFMYSEIKDP